MIDDVLSTSDAARAQATLRRLMRAGLARFAVTGGIAIAWHLAQADGPAEPRSLHDLDLVVPGLDAVPHRLGDAFALRHVHPDALPGRMLVQAVDRANALRVDLFGPHGRTIGRSRPAAFGDGAVPIVSRGDVLARLTALLLDLGLGEAVPPKHARDFLALSRQPGDPVEGEAAWADHRRTRHPPTFAQACVEAAALVAARGDLLVDRPSPFARSPCALCRDHAALKVSPVGLGPAARATEARRPAGAG